MYRTPGNHPLVVNSFFVRNVKGCLFISPVTPRLGRLHWLPITGFCLIWIFFWTLDFDLDSDKDVPTSLPSTTAPSLPATDVSAHRSCTHCTRRMSSYKYDKHSLCLNYRDVQCSLDVRCDECKSWSSELMLDYLKHRKSLVLKGKKSTTPSTSSSSSSPSLPPAVTTAACVGSPLLSTSFDEKLGDYLHLILANFLSQSGSIRCNPSFSVPPVVPDSCPPVVGELLMA